MILYRNLKSFLTSCSSIHCNLNFRIENWLDLQKYFEEWGILSNCDLFYHICRQHSSSFPLKKYNMFCPEFFKTEDHIDSSKKRLNIMNQNPKTNVWFYTNINLLPIKLYIFKNKVYANLLVPNINNIWGNFFNVCNILIFVSIGSETTKCVVLYIFLDNNNIWNKRKRHHFKPWVKINRIYKKSNASYFFCRKM